MNSAANQAPRYVALVLLVTLILLLASNPA